jgi:hypothetical protein
MPSTEETKSNIVSSNDYDKRIEDIRNVYNKWILEDKYDGKSPIYHFLKHIYGDYDFHDNILPH